MKLKIALLPGDGIGPEVTREAVRILKAVSSINGYDFQFAEYPIGGTAIKQFGKPLPENTLKACLDANAVLLGAVGSPEFDSVPREIRPETGLLALRKALGGFANLRPVKAYAALADCSPLKPEIAAGADVLIIRELLGGLYFGEPRGFTDAQHNAAFNTLRYSAEEVERVAHIAFRQARNRKKKVTSVDKANVLETSQLWRSVVTAVATQYPDVKLEHAYVDSFAMRLIQSPTSFDVVVTENLFGDILSDEAAVLGGSLGMLASATIGGKVDLYEPVHGSAPDIAGKGVANPLGAIASAAMLLRHTGKLEADANMIDAAIAHVLEAGHRTPDLYSAKTKKYNATWEVGGAVEQQFSDSAMRRFAFHAV